MMRKIFRRVNGKLKLFTVKSRKLDTSGDRFTKRQYEAFSEDGKKIGDLKLRYYNDDNYVHLDNVTVLDDFRGQGVSSGMFDRVLKALRKTKAKSIRSDELLHEAQIKIRSKHKSKFIVTDEYGEMPTKLVDEDEAIRYIRNIKKDRGRYRVKASTRVKKK